MATELTADQVKAQLQTAGYTDVRNVPRERNDFDADAVKDGQKVQVDIDAKPGMSRAESEEEEKSERGAKSD